MQYFPIDCSGRWLRVTVHLTCLLKCPEISFYVIRSEDAYSYWEPETERRFLCSRAAVAIGRYRDRCETDEALAALQLCED